MVEARNPRLNSLTSLRFFAAFAIVLAHSEPAIVRRSQLAGLVWAAPGGVDFFFVLSGFVLTWSGSVKRGSATFYWHRFARVWPLHALTWAAALVILAAYGSPVGILPAIAALLLVQGWVNSTQYYGAANAVSWSLSCEMLFYAAFPPIVRRVTSWQRAALIRGVVACYAIMLVWALVVQEVTHGTTPIWAQYDLPLWRLPEFIIGILLARLVESGVRLRISRSTAVVSVLLALAFVDLLHHWRVFGADPGPPSLILLPFVVLALMVFAGSDADGQSSILQHPWLVRLGEWSFALYLIQWPLLQIIGQELGTHSLAVALAYETLFLVAVIALSGATYLVFERPVERWLRQLGPQGPTRRRGEPGRHRQSASPRTESRIPDDDELPWLDTASAQR